MPHDLDDQFYADARRRMMSYVRHLYPRFAAEDVEEVAQQAILTYFAYRRTHEVANPLAVLHRMARGIATNLHRRRLRFDALLDGPDGPVRPDGEALVAPPPSLDWDPLDVARLLILEWISAQRPNDLDVMELELQGLKHKEIAERLGLTHEAVRQRISRCHRAIASHVCELGIDACVEAWREERGRS